MASLEILRAAYVGLLAEPPSQPGGAVQAGRRPPRSAPVSRAEDLDSIRRLRLSLKSGGNL